MGKIRTQQVAIPKRRPKPPCPIHRIDMTFSAERLRWVCTYDGCTKVAYPADSEEGKPIIGRGGIELIRAGEDDDQRIFLRAKDNNVYIEVTPYIVNFLMTRSSGSPPKYDLKLSFDSLIEWDGLEKTKG